MGCIFSQQQALSFQKKRKIPAKRPERFVPFYGASRPIKRLSELQVERNLLTSQVVTPCTQIFEDIRQDVSTLAFLMGGKNFPDEELVFGYPSCNNKEATPEEKKVEAFNLPECVIYEGLHDKGFHLFTIDSEKYINSVDVSDSILDAISALTGDGRCVVVYRHQHLHTAYLPNPSGYGARELFNSLATRLGNKLQRIVYYNPSWYVQVCLDIQSRTGRYFFSEVAMNKLTFTTDEIQLAKMTGFPGEIKIN